MTPMSSLAYSHGTSTTPLLGETIGANLRRISASQPDAECLVSCQQHVRMTYGEFDRAVGSFEDILDSK